MRADGSVSSDVHPLSSDVIPPHALTEPRTRMCSGSPYTRS